MRPMRVSAGLVCRVMGKFYARVSVRAGAPFSELHCAARAGDASTRVQAHPLGAGQAGASQTWVLELPSLDGRISVDAWPDDRRDEAASLSFEPAVVKWLSRLNYRLRADECRELRDSEPSFAARAYQVNIDGRFEAEGGTIWRLHVEWAGNPARKPVISLEDVHGAAVDFRLFPFEFQQAGDGDSEQPHQMSLSVLVPRMQDGFLFVASDDSEGRDAPLAPGFAAVSPSFDASMASAARERMTAAGDDGRAYRRWLAAHRATRAELAAQRARPVEGRPLLSVAVLGSDASLCAETARSVGAQTYGVWELLVGEGIASGADSIAALAGIPDWRVRAFGGAHARHRSDMAHEAAGDYVVFAGQGDLLEPNALSEIADAIERDGRPDVVYCDGDAIDSEGACCRPVFRTRLDMGMMHGGNWVGGFFAIERSLLAGLGHGEEADGEADAYDVLLRACERKARFAHIPKMLHHRRIADASDTAPSRDSLAAQRRVLQSHFDRCGIAGTVEVSSTPAGLRMRYDVPCPHPLVSIVIPSKDHVDVLDACIRSIVEKSTYDAYEIVVVENNSADAATFSYYERLQGELGCVRVVTWPDGFNYSKIINFGAQAARGEFLLLLNNDTEVIAGDFIEEMLGMLQQPEVGVVGAKLLFRDGLVQHAGMAVGPFDALVHVNQNFTASRGGYLDRALVEGDFSAVTGACQMVRASVFEQLGGYDEELAVGFNDADFCLRAWEAGLRVVLAPRALLHHYEFTSRGRELADPGKMERWKREQSYFMRKWPEPFAQGDPFTNPNLMRDSLYYHLG